MNEVALIVPIVAIGLTFGFLMFVASLSSKEKQARMKLLEEAVKQGNMDADTRQRLIEAVSGRRQAVPPVPGNAPNRMMRLVLFIGWIALLVGAAIAILAGIEGRSYQDSLFGGVVVACVGFALVTYPFVVRELEGRGPAKAPR